jgi:aspartyl/asparaginyl-tRNA synthetase
MNQFLHDLKQLQETGDCDPHDTSFMKKEVMRLIEKSTVVKWQKIKREHKINLDHLDNTQLYLLEEDLKGYKFLRFTQLVDILDLNKEEREQKQALLDHEMEKGLETAQAIKDNL